MRCRKNGPTKNLNICHRDMFSHTKINLVLKNFWIILFVLKDMKNETIFLKQGTFYFPKIQFLQCFDYAHNAKKMWPKNRKRALKPRKKITKE